MVLWVSLFARVLISVRSFSRRCSGCSRPGFCFRVVVLFLLLLEAVRFLLTRSGLLLSESSGRAAAPGLKRCVGRRGPR